MLAAAAAPFLLHRLSAIGYYAEEEAKDGARAPKKGLFHPSEEGTSEGTNSGGRVNDRLPVCLSNEETDERDVRFEPPVMFSPSGGSSPLKQISD